VGALLLLTTCLWTGLWREWPVASAAAGLRLAVGAAVILLLSALLWQMVNLGGTPWQGSGMDPGGRVAVQWMVGLWVWLIVGVQTTSQMATMPKGPLSKLPSRLKPVLGTILAVPMALISYVVAYRFLVPTTEIAVMLGCIVATQNLLAATFAHYPFRRLRRPRLTIFVTQVVTIGLWMGAARLPFAFHFDRLATGPSSDALLLPYDVFVMPAFWMLLGAVWLAAGHALLAPKPAPHEAPGVPLHDQPVKD
jgi:hypothetical protein